LIVVLVLAVIAPINTNVSLEARPVTQQGLEGMRARTAMGPGRQIADKSYYLSELRAKMSDLQRETRSLQEESERAARDAQVYSALERRYEERVSEVRVLEGQLADFNLAFDKVRTSGGGKRARTPTSG
jgi:intraflagellar transport protein 74